MKMTRRSKRYFMLLFVGTATIVITTLTHISSKEAVQFAKVLENPGSSSNAELVGFSSILDEDSGATKVPTVLESTTFTYQYPYGFIINNPEKCTTKKDLKLVMIVISAPSNSEARLAIRETWGTASVRADVAMVFLLGATTNSLLQTMIVEEHNHYGDIVQGNFTDTYRNLTLKSIALLRWANSFCKNAGFVLKVDDDNFVHVPNLLGFLQRKSSTKKAVFGNLFKDFSPIRDKSNKWHVTEKDYPGERYPDFMSGPAYVISNDCVEDLLNATRVVKPIAVEDVYITGLCAEHASISRFHHRGFAGYMYSDHLSSYLRNPDYFKNLFTAHSFLYTSFYPIWQAVNK